MPAFVDKVTIHLHAGRGGDGAVAFHREKYVAAGGPDGGDGGRGGSVIIVPDDNMTTLMDFRYKRKYTAQDGANGQGKRCAGKDGDDLVVKVPRGTVIRDPETNAVMHDMSDGEMFVAAKGGRGGWGNMHFATPTRQVPRFAKPGLPGETRDIILELKLLADVGLIGFPNVGKSTLLSVVSKAQPKIANYHFTTLYPNLGVVYVDEGTSFVMADIPGLIEGASQGAGLGHDFLRHVERCRLLVHVVDVSGSEGRNPIEDFETINRELRKYEPKLAECPQIVAANKCDLLTEEDALPPAKPFEVNYIAPEPVLEGADSVTIDHRDGIWHLEGAWLQRAASTVNFSDYESRLFFDRTLRKAGIFDRLEEMGIRDGETVCIYDLMFEFRY